MLRAGPRPGRGPAPSHGATTAWVGGCGSTWPAPKLLITDEFGVGPYDRTASTALFTLVSARYERGSIILTSTKGFAEWGEVLGDTVIATAILDRLLRHSHVMSIRGESYRLREKRQAGLFGSRVLSEPEVKAERYRRPLGLRTKGHGRVSRSGCGHWLRREVRILREEREILKEAAAFFARETDRAR